MKNKKFLIFILMLTFLTSCSLIKTYTVRAPQLNSMIGKNLDTSNDLGIASIHTKHLGSVIQNKKIYTTVEFTLDSLVTTISGTLTMSYILKYDANRIYINNLVLEKVIDSNGKSYPVDLPAYKIPLNAIAKNVLSQEIYNLDNINLPFNKKVSDIEMKDDSIVFHLEDKNAKK